MVSANREMVVYCFDTLVAHYNDEQVPPPAFDEGQQVGSSMDSCNEINVEFRQEVYKSFVKQQAWARYESCVNTIPQAGKAADVDTSNCFKLLEIGSVRATSVNCCDISFDGNPLFVTWKKVVNGYEPRLRGCIGTLSARDIVNGFKDYALTSALRDHRFPPIQAKELPFLQCTVSILTNYENAANYLDWEVGKHGIIIEFTDPDYNTKRSATYLPDVAAQEGWTTVEAINSLMRKAGYRGAITDSVRNRIRLTRYQSTLFTMHFSDYVNYVKTTRGSAPSVAGLKSY